jgi:hypothetical protein
MRQLETAVRLQQISGAPISSWRWLLGGAAIPEALVRRGALDVVDYNYLYSSLRALQLKPRLLLNCREERWTITFGVLRVRSPVKDEIVSPRQPWFTLKKRSTILALRVAKTGSKFCPELPVPPLWKVA